MSKEEKGYLYQEYEPTPDKPCEIKGKNLLQNEKLVIRSVPIKYVNNYDRLQNNWNELKKFLEKEKDRLARECSQIYEDSLGKTRLVNEDIYNEVKNIFDKMQELETNNE